MSNLLFIYSLQVGQQGNLEKFDTQFFASLDAPTPSDVGLDFIRTRPKTSDHPTTEQFFSVPPLLRRFRETASPARAAPPRTNLVGIPSKKTRLFVFLQILGAQEKGPKVGLFFAGPELVGLKK